MIVEHLRKMNKLIVQTTLSKRHLIYMPLDDVFPIVCEQVARDVADVIKEKISSGMYLTEDIHYQETVIRGEFVMFTGDEWSDICDGIEEALKNAVQNRST